MGRGHRQAPFVTRGTARRSGKVVVDPEVIRRDLKREGRVTLGQVLRSRVGCVPDGVVLASWNFVNQLFPEYRDRLGPTRRNRARRLQRLGALGKLTTMRNLRVDVVGPNRGQPQRTVASSRDEVRQADGFIGIVFEDICVGGDQATTQSPRQRYVLRIPLSPPSLPRASA